MIKSFKDQGTEDIYDGKTSREARRLAGGLHKIAARKLDMIQYATLFDDLKTPPGNRLHALEDDLTGYHSISINDQWRIIFKWTPEGAEDVQITDYH